MNFETIIFEEKENIGLLTLNRPETINALNQKMIEELGLLFDELDLNDRVRVLIITGSGAKGFCSGMDMKESASMLFEATPDMIYKYQSLASRLFYKMRCIPQPVIAAVHGAASALHLVLRDGARTRRRAARRSRARLHNLAKLRPLFAAFLFASTTANL